jgi:hypothetical protein
MTPLARANDVIESAELLDQAITDALAFRHLLENVRTRTTAAGEEEHAVALRNMLAALLRAEIGTVTAIFDPYDKRGNRASLGHVVEVLKDTAVRRFLVSRRPAIPAKFDQLERDYAAIAAGSLLKRIKLLRHKSVAHLLKGARPRVPYEDIFELEDEAERLVGLLFKGLQQKADFMAHGTRLVDTARLFWDTYFAGMRGPTPPPPAILR